MNIIARKPRVFTNQNDGNTAEVVLVDRGAPSLEINHVQRYVTGIVTPDTLKYDEWVWGHYFTNLKDATADFDARQ